MNYDLTEPQQMIKDMCRKISEEKVKPVRAALDDKEEFPWGPIKEYAAADLMGLYLPEEYGGFGGGTMEFCLAVEEISRICGGVGVTFAASALGCVPILLFVNEEQKKKYIPPIAKGTTLAAFGLTEP